METRACIVVCFVLIVACESNKDAPPPDPSKMTEAQIIEAGMKVMLDMSKISEANVDDCDQAADRLSAFVDRHEAMIEAFQRVASTPEKKEEVTRKHEKELALIAERSIPLEKNCRDHERLRAVFQRLVE